MGINMRNREIDGLVNLLLIVPATSIVIYNCVNYLDK